MIFGHLLSVKLDSIIHLYDKKYDTIIIDEGQDFENFGLIYFKMSMLNGSKIIFSDQMQNIFDRDGVIPNQSKFFQYELKNNCRNTRTITSFLSNTIRSRFYHIQIL